MELTPQDLETAIQSALNDIGSPLQHLEKLEHLEILGEIAETLKGLKKQVSNLTNEVDRLRKKV